MIVRKSKTCLEFNLVNGGILKNRRGCYFLIIFLLLLVGCRGSGDHTPTPTEIIPTATIPTVTTPKLVAQPPNIRGTIKDIHKQDNYVTGFFVEGSLDPDLDPYNRFEKAGIGIDEKTRVYIKQGDIYLKTEVTDLSAGRQVEVLFIGPILTSDPVQATAEEIIILK